tara:strand:- start:928 stop:1821 length:894 start_codon:yes stop_codon:yes gene_type:complete
MPEWARPYWTGAAQKARRESNVDYEKYGGQRIASFDPMESQAFRQTQALGNAGPRPELDYAFGQTQQAGQTGGSTVDWNVDTYQKYANPYLEQVMAPGRERIMENYSNLLPAGLRDVQMASGQGGILGGRTNLEMAGVAKSISDATAMNLREFEAESRYQSYDEARKAALDFDANRQSGARLQLDAASSAGQIAELQQNQALQRISAMQEAGIARRDMEQAIRNMAYEDFMESKNWNKEQLNWLTGILSGSPYAQTGSSSVSTMNTPGASPISQAAGLGIAGVGAYNMYQNNKNKNT